MRIYPIFAVIVLSALFLFAVLMFGAIQTEFIHSILPSSVSELAPILLVLCVLPLSSCVKYLLNPIEREMAQHNVMFDETASWLPNEKLRMLLDKAEVDHPVAFGIIENIEINAFAISNVFPRRSLITFTTGLLRTANEEQLLAIAGHEIGHVKYRDSWQKSVLLSFHKAIEFYPYIVGEYAKSVLKPLIGLFGFIFLAFGVILYTTNNTDEFSNIWMLVGVASKFLVPIFIAIVLPTVISRILDTVFFYDSKKREYKADLYGAKLVSSEAMISGLMLVSGATISKKASVFDSHPPMIKRIEALQGEARQNNSEG